MLIQPKVDGWQTGAGCGVQRITGVKAVHGPDGDGARESTATVPAGRQFWMGDIRRGSKTMSDSDSGNDGMPQLSSDASDKVDRVGGLRNLL